MSLLIHIISLNVAYRSQLTPYFLLFWNRLFWLDISPCHISFILHSVRHFCSFPLGTWVASVLLLAGGYAPTAQMLTPRRDWDLAVGELSMSMTQKGLIIHKEMVWEQQNDLSLSPIKKMWADLKKAAELMGANQWIRLILKKSAGRNSIKSIQMCALTLSNSRLCAVIFVRENYTKHKTRAANNKMNP